MNSSRLFGLKLIFGSAIAAVTIGCDPGDGSQEFAEGLKAVELRQYKKAETLLSKACELDSGNVDALLALTRVCLQLDLDRARVTAERALKLRADADVKLTLAEVFYHQREYVKAVGLFSAVAEDTKVSNAMRSRAYTGRGIVEMSENRHHDARVSFLCALRLDRKDNPSAFYHLGHLYNNAFEFPEAAIEQFEIFVRMPNAPSDKVAKTIDVYLPAIRNNIATRAQQYVGNVHRDSNASAAFLAKAEASLKSKQFKTALARYEDALKADPLSSPAALGKAKLLARDTSAAGKTKAFEAYKTACRLSPRSYATLLEGARHALEQNQPLIAVKFYSRAVAVNPVKYDALDGLIRAYGKVSGETAKSAAVRYQKYRDFLKK